MQSRTALAIAVALSLATGADRTCAHLVPLPDVGPPLLLRLKGVLTDSRAAASTQGFTVVSFGFAAAPASVERWLGVTDVRTVGGDQAVSGKTVLWSVAMWQPNFLVEGPPDLSAALQRIPPGTQVEIEGLVVRSPNGYLLRSVRADEPR